MVECPVYRVNGDGVRGEWCSVKIIKYPEDSLLLELQALLDRTGQIEFAEDTAARESNYLDFEQPIADLDSKIDELSICQPNLESISEGYPSAGEIKNADRKNFQSLDLAKSTTCKTSKASLHLRLCAQLDGFDELHGDRLFGDDQGTIGIGEFRGRP